MICLLKHYGIICLFRTVDVTGISSLNVSTVESVSVTLNPEFGVYAGDI